jgi:hypothetical protein
MFRILLDNGHETLGYTAGKMRRYRIRIFLGDRVRVELSPTISIEGASSTGTGRHTRPLQPQARTASSNRRAPAALHCARPRHGPLPLRDHARSANRKLVDVSSAVVDGHRLLPKEP